VTTVPKIELHVHLEGTVRPHTLLEIARRNGQTLPFSTVEEARPFYEFRDFTHFIEVWNLTTNVLRAYDDFRQVVVDYAAEAASHGVVYIEGIVSPFERLSLGLDADALFSGYCDGAQQAREELGVEVRLTPDIARNTSPVAMEQVVPYAIKYRERGVVGLGLGGSEVEYPPEPFTRCFDIARDGGLGSVPHAGEVAGPSSVRRALDALHADRIRHGIRAVEDPALLAELADRGIVCDVCPTSNVRTGAVRSLDEHPLPRMVEAGVMCTVNTDDPAMFDTDLGREYAQLDRLGITAKQAYDAGLAGALCDDGTRSWLRTLWPSATSPVVTSGEHGDR
jgi:aminodeoxyfutalosine deaminase